MIGTELASRPRAPLVAALLLILALGCLIVAVVLKDRDWMLAGAMPLALGIQLWLTRESSFRATLTEQGLVVSPEERLVSYEQFRAVMPADLRERRRLDGKSFAIIIQYGRDLLRVPSRLNVSSIELFDFLASRVRIVQTMPANSAVAEYMQRQVATFGADHVWSFQARSQLGLSGSERPYRRMFFMWVAALVGVIWCIAGSVWRMEVWSVLGGMMIFVGLFGGLLFFAVAKGSAPRIKNWQTASLVISPIGFALAQGDLRGELRWNEIRDIRLQFGSGGMFTDISARGQGVLVRVDGANILIADLYEAPIQDIHHRLAQLWRRGE